MFFCFPLVLSIFFFFIKKKNINVIRFLGLLGAFILCCWSFMLLIKFIDYVYWYEGIFYEEIQLIVKKLTFFEFKLFGLMDGLSILLIFLTSLLCLSCIILSWNIIWIELLYSLIFLVNFLIMMSFFVSDLLLFYIFFEAVLIPMFLIIGIWGSRIRKITAAYRLFLYTLIGSISFLSVVIFLYSSYGTTYIYNLKYLLFLSKEQESLLWLGLFIALAVKVPIYPIHTWLPEAHAEAPTVGSVLLAGILLKLGPYGLIKFSNFLFPYGVFFFRPVIYLLTLGGLYYTSLTAIRQTDIKKIIAYSSIGHMALVLLGIFTYTIEGFIGSFLLLIAHGFVSGGLFLIIGLMYDRLKTRVFFYYKGLLQLYPFTGFFLFLFLLGNIGFPSTMNFISEFLIIISLMEINTYLCIIASMASIIVLGFNLFLYGRIFYGAILMKKNHIIYNKDLIIREICSILVLLLPVYIYGLIAKNIIILIEVNSIFFLKF